MDSNASPKTGSQTSTSQSQEPSHNLTRLRRFILVLTGLITVIATFYAIENWRGKRAWEKYKKELEAKGQVMDWAAYIPAPIPDDQNFFKAPKMAEWMTGRGRREITELIGSPNAHAEVLIAQIKVIDADTKTALSLNSDDMLVQYDDPNVLTNVTQFVEKIVGPTSDNAIEGIFVANLSERANPPTLFVQSTKVLVGVDLAHLFGKNRAFFRAPNTQAKSLLGFRVESSAPNTYRLISNNLYTAADYLEWSDRIDKYLDPIREALKRPYARMDGDYEHPFDCPIPNFVVFRQISQTLANRAKLYLMQNNPERALDQLTLIHNLCRVLESRPSNQPMTLVAAMINVAIQGLYTSVIAEGLQKHVWHESQLTTLQQQLNEVDLLPFVASATHLDRVAMCATLQLPSAEVAKMFKGFVKTDISDLWRDRFYFSIRLAPRGWLYQNMIATAQMMQPIIDGFDRPRSRLSPRVSDAGATALGNMERHWNAYNFIACLSVPNFTRAMRTCAKNQTLIHLAYIACALERYHLTHKEFPESLDALVPQYATSIPHDIINGQLLHYHRTADGQFKLYSVAWNEKDDGGTSGDNETGDWVWQYPQP